MKKLKRILIPVLTLLIMTGVLSVFAFANAGSEQPSAVSEESPLPSVASKNVKYSSYLYLMAAIPEEQIPEGATPALNVGYTESSTDYIVTEFELLEISVGGKMGKYFVFESRGVVAQDIAREHYLTPTVTLADGTEIIGKTTKYSIIEYCYERLCADGFALKVEANGIDYLRRELYESLINYGVCAYDLLGDESIPSPEEFGYISIEGSLSDYNGEIAEETEITVALDSNSIPKNYYFAGWKICETSSDGKTGVTEILKTSFTYTAKRGGASICAIYEVYPEYRHQEEILAAEKQDEIDRQNEWTALRGALISKLGYSEANADNIIYELKNLYTLYGREMVTWAAGLYSKGYMDIENGIWAGGFYASSAGMNVAGYGPDLQSTVQLLRFLQQSGVINSISKDIPEWMQTEMVYFAKSLQHENGFFYHPQWGKEFTDTKISRRGRDLGWGVSLLSDFGAKPVYSTPSGVSGDGITADEYLELLGIDKSYLSQNDSRSSVSLSAFSEYGTSGAALTVSLGGGISNKISGIILCSDESGDSTTAYMETHTAFINYLLTVIEPGMRTSPYSTGNTLNATDGQIGNFSKILGEYAYTAGDEAATPGATAEDYKRFDGMTLKEMVLCVLDGTVNPINGLFGSWTESGGWSNDLSFANTNGFFKVISIYNNQKHPYPAPALAAISLIDNLTNPNLLSTGNACDVYNVWNALNSLRSNVSSTEEIYAIVTDTSIMPAEASDEGAELMTVNEFIAKALEIRGAEAVRVTFDKIKGYKKEDGGFAHSYFRGTTSHQGCPIAPANNVSDVDGTCISSTGLVRSLFDAFGLSSYRPKFFGKADYMIFIDTVEAARPVRKAPTEAITEDFEDENLKNEISGSYEITDGKLITDGELCVLRSELSTVGDALTVGMNVSLSDKATLTLYSGEREIDTVIFEPNGDAIKVTAQRTGSFAICEMKNGSARIDLTYIIGGAKREFKVVSYGTAILCEDLDVSVTDPYDVTSITVNAEGEAIIDDLIFALLAPDYSHKNNSGRLDFSSLVDGVLDEQAVSNSIRFTNQTPEGENHSEALIVSDGKNKFLRLDDKWSSGSAAQNYFDFLTETENRNTFVFESKMRIVRKSGGSVPITLMGDSATYYGGLGISNGYLCAGVSKTKSGVSSSLVKTTVKPDEWFTVRVEYTAADVYSEDTFRVAIYINDTLISESSERSADLEYLSASRIQYVRMACDTNWFGTLDYDDIYLGSKANYKPVESGTDHTHVLAERIENKIDSTCTEWGSYTLITYCGDTDCGKLLSTSYLKTPPECRADSGTVENLVDASCYEDGSYDTVYRCTSCKKELWREHSAIPAHHTEAVREEGRIESSCTSSGGYDTVTYCTSCNKELSRVHFNLPLDYHRMINGVCTVCGGSDFEVFGIEDFESIEAGNYLVDKTVHSFDKTESGTYVNLHALSNHINAAIVSEGDNKYLSFEKTRNDTNTNTWVDFIRDTNEVVSEIIVEARVNYNLTAGSGTYVRLYTGRTTSGSGDGTRIINHTMAKNGGYVKYDGVTTHAKIGEWFSMRITLVLTNNGYVYTFMIKNETGSAITFDGKSYGTGEFIPYCTTTKLLQNPVSINDVNGFTFMQSTNTLCTVSVDDAYIGGDMRYVSRK